MANLINSELNKVYKLLGLVLAKEMPTYFLIENPDKKIELERFQSMINDKLNMTMEPYWSLSGTNIDTGIKISTYIIHNKFTSQIECELYYQVIVSDGMKTIIYAVKIARDKLEFHLIENFNALLSISSDDSLIGYIYKYIKGILNSIILKFIFSKSEESLKDDEVMVLCEDDEIHIVPYEYWSKNITL